MADTAARSTPDLILHRGRFTTLDRAHPLASAVAIKDGRFVAVGGDEILASAGPPRASSICRARACCPA